MWRWRIWPTWTLVAADHFSTMVTAVCPLEGPNAGWVVGAMEDAFAQHGAPQHLITDQEGVFVSGPFGGLLRQWNVRQRFGAVGRHGSIAVTERVIRTLGYEWLRRVQVIRGLDHLEILLADFVCYYDSWRPHTTLKGAVPDLIHAGQEWSAPARTAKTVPAHVERRFLPEIRVTAFRLAAWPRRLAALCSPSRPAAHSTRTPPDTIPPPRCPDRGLMPARCRITPASAAPSGTAQGGFSLG